MKLKHNDEEFTNHTHRILIACIKGGSCSDQWSSGCSIGRDGICSTGAISFTGSSCIVISSWFGTIIKFSPSSI